MTDVLRRATLDDSEAIARIYNQGIEDRLATFETEPRTPETVRGILEEHGGNLPTVVVERAGHVVAFAWVSPYRSRPCYAGVGEHSVYVARDARGTGAGFRALMGLIEAAEAEGFWKLVSRIFPENAASRRLHARVGFREVGIYRKHARLDGVWRDVVIVEKLLGEAESDMPSSPEVT